MADTVTFYDYRGSRIEEVACHARCKWSLRGMGVAKIRLGQAERKLIPKLIRYGNLVTIEDSRAGDWSGVIRTPESSGSARLELTAYTAEDLLKDRLGRGRLEGTTGEQFAQLIEMSNRRQDIRLRTGTIEVYGKVGTEKASKDELLYNVFKRIVDKEKGDFAFEHAFDAQRRLYFEASWYYQRGKIRDEVVLREGHNIEFDPDKLVEKQGRIVNSLRVVKDAAAEGDAKSYTAEDDASMTEFGIREGIEVVDGNPEKKARKLLNELKQLRLALDPVALDVDDLFFYLGLGDIVKLEAVVAGSGVETYVRVVGKDFDSTIGKMPLVLEEVFL